MYFVILLLVALLELTNNGKQMVGIDIFEFGY